LKILQNIEDAMYSEDPSHHAEDVAIDKRSRTSAPLPEGSEVMEGELSYRKHYEASKIESSFLGDNIAALEQLLKLRDEKTRREQKELGTELERLGADIRKLEKQIGETRKIREDPLGEVKKSGGDNKSQETNEVKVCTEDTEGQRTQKLQGDRALQNENKNLGGERKVDGYKRLEKEKSLLKRENRQKDNEYGELLQYSLNLEKKERALKAKRDEFLQYALLLEKKETSLIARRDEYNRIIHGLLEDNVEFDDGVGKLGSTPGLMGVLWPQGTGQDMPAMENQDRAWCLVM
jgi:hypothetical protein